MNDILFGNNNSPVIKRLSGRYFKAARSRNIIAVIAIVLTTILFTTIFTLGSGLMDTIHDQNIRKAGGDGQAVLSYISDEVYDNVSGSSLIDRIAYTKAVSYRLNNPGLARWRSDMWYMDDTALEFARYTPTTGRRPEAENEIIADTKTLDLRRQGDRVYDRLYPLRLLGNGQLEQHWAPDCIESLCGCAFGYFDLYLSCG